MTLERAGDLDVLCCHRLAELPEWDEIASPAGGFYSTVQWLKLYEAAGSRYLVVRHRGRALAVLPCFVAHRGGVLPPLSDPAVLFGDRPPAELLESLYPQVLCGMFRGYSNRLLVRTDVERSLRPAILGRLLQAARELGRQEGVRLQVFGYLPASDVRELLAIDDRLVPVFATSEAAVEDITTFEAYLERFNAHRKHKIRREMRLFIEHGLRVEQRRLPDVVEQVSDIVTQHEARFDPSVTHRDIREAFDDWLAQGYGDICRVFCALQGSAIVGVSIYVVADSTYYARDTAILPSVPRQAAVYFNISFYHTIGAAAAEGIRRIHNGIGTFSAKVERGATATPLWFVFDPGDWDPAVLASMRAAATTRLMAEAAELRKLRPEPSAESQLELAWSLRALGHPAS